MRVGEWVSVKGAIQVTQDLRLLSSEGMLLQ
jgi:hypothetical protein